MVRFHLRKPEVEPNSRLHLGAGCGPRTGTQGDSNFYFKFFKLFLKKIKLEPEVLHKSKEPPNTDCYDSVRLIWKL